MLPERWHKRWVTVTHTINAAIARNLPRMLGYQFIVLARPKDGALGAGRE